MPKVSVIVPVYGVEKYIERCCISLFEQSYKDFELIFVNDCSKDNSEKILNEVIARYQNLGIVSTVIKHASNQGLSATRETAIKAASGEYILCVDSDDYIATHMLEVMINRVEASDADIVYCDFSEFKNNVFKYQNQSSLFTEPLDVLAAMLREELFWCLWNKLIRRSLFLDNDIHWPEAINIGEDFVVVSKLFCHAKKVEYVNQPLYFYNRDNVNSYLNAWSLSACYQNISAVKLVDAYLTRHVQNQNVLQALIQPKLKARYTMLYSFNQELLELASDAFPETNHQIFSYKKTPVYWKFALYFLINRQAVLSSMTLRIIWLMKKIRASITF